MRTAVVAAVLVSTALSAARAQNATVVGRVMLRASGMPVTNASVSPLPNGAQRLAGENGAFVLRDLPPVRTLHFPNARLRISSSIFRS